MKRVVRMLWVGAILGFALPFVVLAVVCYPDMEEFNIFALPVNLFWMMLLYLVFGTWLVTSVFGGMLGALCAFITLDLPFERKWGSLALAVPVALVVLYLCGRSVLRYGFSLG
jgi:amino acid permease